MSGEKTLTDIFSKNHSSSGKDFAFGAADVGEQRFRRKRWPQQPDHFNNAAYRRGQNDDLTVADGVGRSRYGPRQSHLACGRVPDTGARSQPTIRPFESIFFKRKPKRTANKSGTDDGDLANGHGNYHGDDECMKSIRSIAFIQKFSVHIPREDYAIFLPTAGAIMRNSSINSANCSG